MLRSVILAAARNDRIKRMVAAAPVSRGIVRRFVAGESLEDAVRATRELTVAGMKTSLDHLGEDTTDREHADAMTGMYVALLERLADEGLTPDAEVSLKLSAVGQRLDESMAADNATLVCAAAEKAGTTVTLDMEDHTTTDSTLAALLALRKDFPGTGAVVQAYLRRTEGDCRELAGAGSRVRLCKGAYQEPESVAFGQTIEVDKSYVRCLNILLGGDGHPMIASHDPRLIAIAGERARWYHREPGSYEYQMLYGIRPEEQKRLVTAGETLRIYLPYGDQWYGYLMRRLAERPANLTFFLRSLATRT